MSVVAAVNKRFEVKGATVCGVCAGRMMMVRLGVYQCRNGCWHCTCCGDHFHEWEACGCGSCVNCGELRLRYGRCANCGHAQ